jgi:hypothetical protein
MRNIAYPARHCSAKKALARAIFFFSVDAVFPMHHNKQKIVFIR